MQIFEKSTVLIFSQIWSTVDFLEKHFFQIWSTVNFLKKFTVCPGKKNTDRRPRQTRQTRSQRGGQSNYDGLERLGRKGLERLGCKGLI